MNARTEKISTEDYAKHFEAALKKHAKYDRCTKYECKLCIARFSVYETYNMYISA